MYVYTSADTRFELDRFTIISTNSLPIFSSSATKFILIELNSFIDAFLLLYKHINLRRRGNLMICILELIWLINTIEQLLKQLFIWKCPKKISALFVLYLPSRTFKSIKKRIKLHEQFFYLLPIEILKACYCNSTTIPFHLFLLSWFNEVNF